MKTMGECLAVLKRKLVLTAGTAALAGTTAFGALDLGNFNVVNGVSPSDGKPVSVSAHFVDVSTAQSPNKLQITVANTGSTATFGIGDTIYGLFFKGTTISA